MSHTSLLSEEDIQTINENFGLDLDFKNATHYRAALVIWDLWKNKTE